MADDPYLIPGTAVLKNLLGVSSEATLSQLEADLTRDRIQQLALAPVAGRFDLAHLKKIHAYIFQDVYAWAGEPRTISISKGASMFCLPQHLEFAAEDIFGKLARENHLKGLSREAVRGSCRLFLLGNQRTASLPGRQWANPEPVPQTTWGRGRFRAFHRESGTRANDGACQCRAPGRAGPRACDVSGQRRGIA